MATDLLSAVVQRRYLGAGDLARMLGFTVQTVRNWARRGILPAPIRIQGREMFELAEIEAFLAQRKAERRQSSHELLEAA